MPRYNPAAIEAKWQKYWEENQTFRTPHLPGGKKIYVLDMFPYPSGDGLHVGHPEGYTATDIVCRHRRMCGYSVMHPMGWDAFGLPAEQHAKRTGTPPRITTEKNIGNFRRQLKMLGFSYDWSRELATTDVGYFRWTQFIFLVLFDTWYDAELGKGRPIAELPIPADIEAEGATAVSHYRDEHRLAYQLKSPVNWCPALGTVLANEEVIGGVSERGGHPVVRIPLRQWMLRITAYADRLEKDLDQLDWSESIKLLQRNWIGRSVGAEVDFFVGVTATADGMPSQEEFDYWMLNRIDHGFPRKPEEGVLRIYTTRADTLFGATYMVIAPEHPLVKRLSVPAQAAAVEAYCQQATRKSDLDRTDLAKAKTGVFTGSYAVNPVNGKATPIWVADYVLASYGTGAIMAVPAHDTRDFEFAQQFHLPIVAVVDPGEAAGQLRDEVLAGRAAMTADGTAINSGRFTGLSTAQFKQAIAEDLENKGMGRAAVNYKLRDWLFSRQHFWGEPFPILHELDDAGNFTGTIRAVAAEQLPVDLPREMERRAWGTGQTQSKAFGEGLSPEPPLEQAPHDWLFVTLDGKRYKRETNTMPQWAGSCWYYLRFLDPTNKTALVDPVVEKAWMPVDLYVGGAEHAVLHLLYARFWHKVLFDRGYVSATEPFMKLVNQGMILGEPVYERHWTVSPDTGEKGDPISADKVIGKNTVTVHEDVPRENVEQRGNKVYLKGTDYVLSARAEKMSKSRGNVVNPDSVVAEYGADSLRLYEMFMGPLEAVKPWSMDGVSGVRGFLDRAWRVVIEDRAEARQLHAAVQAVPPTAEQNRMLHKTVKAVSQSINQMSFNTAIARLMEFANFFLHCEVRPKEALEKFILLLSPFSPHLAEELWSALGHPQTLAYEPWPTWDEEAIREDTIEIPIQVNGKLRTRIQVPAEAGKEAIEAAAGANPRVVELLAGKTLVKTIVVPGRMVNYVVK